MWIGWAVQREGAASEKALSPQVLMVLGVFAEVTGWGVAGEEV